MSPNDSAPPGFSVPAQGDVFSTGAGSTPTTVMPGNPTPGGGTAPGGGFSGGSGTPVNPGLVDTSGGSSTGGAGQPAFGINPATGQPFFQFSQAGEQAPIDQFNVDTNPPFTAYPPGVAAPVEGTQLSSADMSPGGLALAAMTLPPAQPGSFSPGYDVEADPAGGFDAVVNGEKHKYSTQQAAEQAFNDLMTAAGFKGYSNAAPAGNTPAPATATPPAGAGKEFDPTTPFWAGSDAGYVNRANAIQRLQAAGNTQDLSKFTNTQLAQTMGNAFITGQQRQQVQQEQASQQQQAKQDTLRELLPIANADPAAIPVINAILQSMGLPAMAVPQGVSPNGISLADWNAMSPAAKTVVLNAMGGANSPAAKDFQAALQNSAPTQRPTGSGVNVQFAPLAA